MVTKKTPAKPKAAPSTIAVVEKAEAVLCPMCNSKKTVHRLTGGLHHRYLCNSCRASFRVKRERNN